MFATVGERYPLGPLGGEYPVWGHEPVVPQGHRVVGRALKWADPGRRWAHVRIVRGVRHDPEEAVRFSHARRPQTPKMAQNEATGFSQDKRSLFAIS
jgi:hypothetical protein